MTHEHRRHRPARHGVTQAQRLGWLLQVNRLYGREPRLTRSRSFAEAFHQAGYPLPSVSAISRWENGITPVTHQRIRGYEAVLRLPANSLTAVSDILIRYASSTTAAAPQLAREPAGTAVADVDELIYTAVNGGVMSGQDWDELTAALANAPTVVLSPKTLWADLTERLLNETSIADGVFWMLRNEALNRLLTHPIGQDAVISVTAAAAADRSIQSMVGSVSVFEATRHHSATQHVLAHLHQPVTDRTFYGALLASVRKIRDGHFNTRELHGILAVLLDISTSTEATSNVTPLAATLVKMMPHTLRAKINARLWKRVTASLTKTTGDDRVVERVCFAASAELPSPARPGHDHVLAHLVHEMLFDPILDVRLYATFLLYSTPYRYPLARAIDGELRACQPQRDMRWAAILLEALRILGGVQQRRHVERILLIPGPVTIARDTAASALGHIGGHSTTEYWATALRACNQRWQHTRSHTDESVLDRLVYALGMAEQQPMLRHVLVTPDLPTRVRNATHWWTQLPAHIRTSARI